MEPRDLLKKLHPNQFSDSKIIDKIECPRALLDFHLSNVNIPETVKTIGDCAFRGCTNLTNITIPSKVTSIEYHAFEYCSSLTKIVIPNSVTSIGSYVFADCTNLKEVRFEMTTVPTFSGACFSKSSGEKITFYFKNSDVASALKSNIDVSTGYHYTTTYGTESTDYSW